MCYNSIGQILTTESVESILWVLFLLHRGGIMKIINLKIDEHYCDVIINRWESFTRKKAELIE